jgi:hypothetical protein
MCCPLFRRWRRHLHRHVGRESRGFEWGTPVPLSSGKAVLSIIPKVAGEHAITAHYGGVNSSFAGSTGEAALTVYP